MTKHIDDAAFNVQHLPGLDTDALARFVEVEIDRNGNASPEYLLFLLEDMRLSSATIERLYNYAEEEFEASSENTSLLCIHPNTPGWILARLAEAAPWRGNASAHPNYVWEPGALAAFLTDAIKTGAYPRDTSIFRHPSLTEEDVADLVTTLLAVLDELDATGEDQHDSLTRSSLISNLTHLSTNSHLPKSSHAQAKALIGDRWVMTPHSTVEEVLAYATSDEVAPGIVLGNPRLPASDRARVFNLLEDGERDLVPYEHLLGMNPEDLLPYVVHNLQNAEDALRSSPNMSSEVAEELCYWESLSEPFSPDKQTLAMRLAPLSYETLQTMSVFNDLHDNDALLIRLYSDELPVEEASKAIDAVWDRDVALRWFDALNPSRFQQWLETCHPELVGFPSEWVHAVFAKQVTA